MLYAYQQQQNKTMKTKTNHKRITARVALLIVAIFFSLGIFAQKSITNYQIKSLNENLLLSSDEIISSLRVSIETDFFYEDQINLEDWMIDLEKFAKNSKPSTIVEDEFIEEELELEEWMIDTDWLKKDCDYFYEAPLQFEDWMCCPKEWTV